MKKLLILIGHIFSIILLIISLGLAIAVMIKPTLLTTTIQRLNGVIEFLGWKNYLLIGGIGFIESIPFVNMAFPGQTFMILISGFVAQTHPILTILVVIGASVIGDTFAYWIGRYKGESILSHYGPLFGLSEKGIKKLKDMIQNHVHRALVASRRNSYARGFVPFFAGITHMKFWEFMIYNLIGAILYGIVIVFLAMLFIGNYEKVVPYIRWIGLGIFGVVILWYGIKYYKNERKNG